ncbi:MAG TPA: protoporphyrinogen oxidase, partial [Acidimicrobiaceae bacterium]|nr:protoporphyrinogen oxidase [Acidimicrobiaceae bacterium]
MSAAPPARVVVVGGGITGLTAAYSLTPAGRALADPAQRDGAAPPGPPHPAVEVLVLESDDRLGGKIRTTDFAGHPVDEGADSFITRTPAAIELCRRLDIGPLVSPAQNGAFVVRTRRRTRLLRMPAGLVLGVPTSLRSMAALAGSGIVSARGVGRAALDLVRRDDWPGTEETVGEMVSRRLGSEMSQSLVGPLLGAVNAGDVDELEAVSAVPQLGEAARRGGSLMLALRRRPTAGTTVWPAGAFADWATARPAGSADASEPVFAGLRDGLGALPDALAA